jgi:hypothetical protein
LRAPAQLHIAAVGPPAAPPQSNQHWGTPRAFLDAVERRFGPIGIDLAAKHDNHVVPAYFGPGSPFGVEDALAPSVLWSDFVDPRLLRWLNPPFENIDPWAAWCASFRTLTTTAMLTHAAVDTKWFEDHVVGKALCLFLRPRMTFVGADDGFPKPLMLSVYGPLVAPGFDTWRWK